MFVILNEVELDVVWKGIQMHDKLSWEEKLRFSIMKYGYINVGQAMVKRNSFKELN